MRKLDAKRIKIMSNFTISVPKVLLMPFYFCFTLNLQITNEMLRNIRIVRIRNPKPIGFPTAF